MHIFYIDWKKDLNYKTVAEILHLHALVKLKSNFLRIAVQFSVPLKILYA